MAISGISIGGTTYHVCKAYVRGYTQQIWLVGGPGPPRPEKYDFVNWDDDSNQYCIWENRIHGNHSPPTS